MSDIDAVTGDDERNPGADIFAYGCSGSDDDLTLADARENQKQSNNVVLVDYHQPSLTPPKHPPPPLQLTDSGMLTLDDIKEILRDLHSTLSEWTASWGPVSSWSAQMKASARPGDSREEIEEYVGFIRQRLQDVHRLPAVDFTVVDHDGLRNAWHEGLNLVKELQYRVAVADCLLFLRREYLPTVI